MSIQSRHSVLTVRTQRSAKALAFGARMGVQITSVPSERKTSSKLEVYLESRSLIRNRARVSRSTKSYETFLACWVTPANAALRPRTRHGRSARLEGELAGCSETSGHDVPRHHCSAPGRNRTCDTRFRKPL